MQPMQPCMHGFHEPSLDPCSIHSLQLSVCNAHALLCCLSQGYILSDPSWNSPAYIFCIYDEKAKAQYVGFSKDLKNSLRTVFTRRPEKAYFFK
jgi:hypothetical protein